MKLKTIFLLIFVLTLVCLSTSISLAQRKTQKRNTKPQPRQTVTPKPRQDENISVTYDKAKDQTTVNLKYALAASSYGQIFYIGAAYSDDTSDLAFIGIISVSRNYRYEKYSNVKILKDGERLSYLREENRGNREARVDENGNAVEIISVVLSVSELKRLASARRVDITVWTDSFALNAGNIYALRDFVAKIEPLELKAQNAKSKSTPKQGVASVPQCSLTIEQSPEVKRIRLGMSTQEVVSRFDNRYGIAKGNKVNMEGVDVVVYAYYGAGEIPKTEEWEFVKYVRFRFLDDKLLVFEIHYDNSELKLWKDTDTFVEVLSKRMTLPAQLVDGKSSEDYTYTPSKWAYCDGWSMELTGDYSSGKIKLTNTAAKIAYLKAAEEKKRAEQEKKRDTFKPQ